MKNLYFLYLLVFLTFSSMFSMAQLRNVDGAQNLAVLYLAEYSETQTQESNKELSLNSVYSSRIGTPELYCFTSGDDDFILVSAECRTRAVLAYSSSPMDARANMPPSLLLLIEDYRREIRFARKSLPPIIIEEAYDSESGNSSLASVTPLISTTWDQTCLYNDSCPADPLANATFCGHVPVGCVGTTLAQLMKYHQYPPSGTGSKSYFHTKYGLQSADFGNTNYNWAAMPDNLTLPSAGLAQIMYHSGVAVSMNYGTYASGANLPDARLALINYFAYSNGAQLVHKQSYSMSAWQSLMQSEIDSARPLIYSAVDPNASGHAWLIDGYQPNAMFHCNWGWGGFYNGYYALTALNPGVNNFSTFHEALIMIEPQAPVLAAHFSADNVFIQAASDVAFSDLSSGSPSSWYWTFPGGYPSSSTSQQPLAINYPLPGKYDVSLKVINGTDTSEIVKPNYIQVTPLADFTADKVSISAGQSIQFTDASMSATSITSWQWSFPGGTPSAFGQQNPPDIEYLNPGIYDVSLTVQSGVSSHAKTYAGMIKVHSSCDTLLYWPLPSYTVDSANQQGFSVMKEDIDGNTPYFGGPPTNHTSNWMSFNDVNTAGDTNFFHGVTSWFVPPGLSNDWLEFGPLFVPAEGLTIQWEHMYWLTDKRDGYEVRVSTTGLGHANFTVYPHYVLADNGPQSDGDSNWTIQEAYIDGSIYSGQDLYFAFHHNANNMSYLFIDNIRVISCQGLSVSLEDVSATTILEIYPNPVVDVLKIDLAGINNWRAEASILDVYGKEVIKFYDLGKSKSTISLATLPGGIYFIRVILENGSQLTQKIIKY